MRPDGIIERFLEIDMPKAGPPHPRAGQHQGYTDVPGLYRMLEQSFCTYQSTHLIRYQGMVRGVMFPYAWKLEIGDTILNFTKEEEYTVQEVEPLFKETGDPGGDYPDVEMWRNNTLNGRFYDRQGSGWVGYAAILVDKNGAEVRPAQSDVLFFKNSRYMFVVRKNVRRDGDKYIVDSTEDTNFTEVPGNGLPLITYFKRREEPASMTGGWFTGNKILKPVVLVDEEADKSNQRIISWLPSELILRFELWGETAYDIDKFEIYFRRYIENITPVLRKNGVQEVAWWQTVQSDRRLRKTGQNIAVEYAFRVQNLRSKLDAKIKDVSLDGPYFVTKLEDEGSSPLGQPIPVVAPVKSE